MRDRAAAWRDRVGRRPPVAAVVGTAARRRSMPGARGQRRRTDFIAAVGGTATRLSYSASRSRADERKIKTRKPKLRGETVKRNTIDDDTRATTSKHYTPHTFGRTHTRTQTHTRSAYPRTCARPSVRPSVRRSYRPRTCTDRLRGRRRAVAVGCWRASFASSVAAWKLGARRASHTRRGLLFDFFSFYRIRVHLFFFFYSELFAQYGAVRGTVSWDVRARSRVRTMRRRRWWKVHAAVCRRGAWAADGHFVVRRQSSARCRHAA